jgi:hypothetical protein
MCEALGSIPTTRPERERGEREPYLELNTRFWVWFEGLSETAICPLIFLRCFFFFLSINQLYKGVLF